MCSAQANVDSIFKCKLGEQNKSTAIVSNLQSYNREGNGERHTDRQRDKEIESERAKIVISTY
jgi:hypothetical protein